MTDLARFLVRHAAFGFALAVFFVGYLLFEDAGGLRQLIAASEVGSLSPLTSFSGLIFSSAQMGSPSCWQTAETVVGKAPGFSDLLADRTGVDRHPALVQRSR